MVVGAGPNGLVAAVTLARAGIAVTVLEAAAEIGGGTRTSELTLPGLPHDHCSAVHPLGVGSPALRELDLERYGLSWLWPEVDLAHPLDGGRGAVLRRDIAATAGALGADGATWRQLFGPLARDFDTLAGDLLGPLLRVPAHPLRLAGFGARALLPSAGLARRWRTEEARALFAGAAAHAFQPLSAPATAGVGLMLVAAGHRYGWPVALGGSRAITDALARLLREHGGAIETGHPVRSAADLPDADIVLLDLAPRSVLDILGERLPGRVRRALGHWRYGPGAYKLDLAVEGGIPWTQPEARRAGTVHVGGTLAEVAAAERDVARGRMPERPFVLVAQQYLADPGRSVGNVHPVWTYAHVPSGYPGDASEAILDQIERFAPGIRDRIVARASRSVAEFEAYNANYVGGDIGTGATTARQVLFRPPYHLGIPGYYLCSAATAPGPGVHGMCGLHAARASLRGWRRT